MHGKLASDNESVREKIIQAAAELFAEKGFDGTSIREIAQRAEVNSAMLYYYFESKEHLYFKIAEYTFEQITKLLDQALAGSGNTQDKLTRFVEADIWFFFHNQHMPRIMMRELLGGSQRLEIVRDKYVRKIYVKMQQFLQEGIDKGELRPINPQLTTFSLIGMILYYVVARSVVTGLIDQNYDEKFIKEFIRHTLGILFHGIIASET